MASWLIKEEPDHYSYDDLERDKTTVWDGVTNNQARMHLRQIAKGDRLLYYHTGNVKAIVGEAKAVKGATADSQSDDPKSVVIHVRAVKRWTKPVTLARIKREPALRTWDLVRNSRLSVMPVNDAQWRRLEELRDEPD